MTAIFKAHSGLEENNDENGQQLKNALHAGSKDAIRTWVTKYYIGSRTGTLGEYVHLMNIQHGGKLIISLHAEKIIKEKKKNGATAGTFYQKEVLGGEALTIEAEEEEKVEKHFR